MSTDVIEVVYFAPTEGLSESDAEAARQANRANLSLGLSGLPCEYTGPMLSKAVSIETFEAIHKVKPFGLYVSSVEVYAGGHVNAYLRRSESQSAAGFVRLRRAA